MATLLHEYTLVRAMLLPATRTSSVQGAAIDRAVSGGNKEAIVAVIVGSVGDGTHAVAIEDSDDGSTGWAAVPVDRLFGEVPTIGTSDAFKVFEVGVTNTRRFLRATITTTGSLTGATICVAVVLGELRFRPVIR